jgi:hypothetical protein
VQNPAQVTRDLISLRSPAGERKLETLRNFTMAIKNKGSWVSDADIAEFITAGHTKA